ncbi:monocarboxylate transporter 7-like isoform X2 [Dermacentor albipictus]
MTAERLPDRTSDVQQCKNSKQVMDKCWGVPVTMAAAAFVVFMPLACYGLLFVLFIEKFSTNREGASWPASGLEITAHLSALFVYALQRCIKMHTIVLLSTLVSFVGIVASAYSPDIAWMTVTFGAAYGLGMGTFIISAGMYVLFYFQKYQAMATSIVYIAWALAELTGQFVLAHLTDVYGLEGALLLIGGLVMQATPIVLLARNPGAITLPPLRGKSLEVSLENGDTKPGCVSNESDTVSTERRSERQQGTQPEEVPASLEEPCTLRHALGIFREPSFYVLALTVAAGDYTISEFSKTIVDYGIDKGIDLARARQLITYSPVGQLLGRFLVPALAEITPIGRRPLYALSFVLAAACMAAVPHVFSFPAMIALTVVEGIAVGYIILIKLVLVADFLGVERTAAACGVIGVVTIPVSLVSPRITGVFRDMAGSYDGFYRMLGAVNLATAAVFAAFILWNWLRKTGEHTKDSNSDKCSATRQ